MSAYGRSLILNIVGLSVYIPLYRTEEAKDCKGNCAGRTIERIQSWMSVCATLNNHKATRVSAGYDIGVLFSLVTFS